MILFIYTVLGDNGNGNILNMTLPSISQYFDNSGDDSKESEHYMYLKNYTNSTGYLEPPP